MQLQGDVAPEVPQIRDLLRGVRRTVARWAVRAIRGLWDAGSAPTEQTLRDMLESVPTSLDDGAIDQIKTFAWGIADVSQAEKVADFVQDVGRAPEYESITGFLAGNPRPTAADLESQLIPKLPVQLTDEEELLMTTFVETTGGAAITPSQFDIFTRSVGRTSGSAEDKAQFQAKFGAGSPSATELELFVERLPRRLNETELEIVTIVATALSTVTLNDKIATLATILEKSARPGPIADFVKNFRGERTSGDIPTQAELTDFLQIRVRILRILVEILVRILRILVEILAAVFLIDL